MAQKLSIAGVKGCLEREDDRGIEQKLGYAERRETVALKFLCKILGSSLTMFL